MSKNYFRLQEKNISIEQMRTFTSDYSNDAEYLDSDMFETEEEYETALAEQTEKYNLTICVSDNAYEKSFGGAAGLENAEIIVLNGTKAFDIYDGARLYSESLAEVARFDVETWRTMQENGEVEKFDN